MQNVSENDIEINCSDCGDKFWWKEAEQDFYRQHNYSKPKRCKSCRAKRKQSGGYGDRNR